MNKLLQMIIDYNIKKECIDTKNGINIGSFRNTPESYFFSFVTLKTDRRNTDVRI